MLKVDKSVLICSVGEKEVTAGIVTELVTVRVLPKKVFEPPPKIKMANFLVLAKFKASNNLALSLITAK